MEVSLQPEHKWNFDTSAVDTGCSITFFLTPLYKLRRVVFKRSYSQIPLPGGDLPRGSMKH